MNFKERLHAKEQLLGTFVKTPSPMICEVLAQTDLDVVCLDAEHSPFDRGTQDLCTLALRAGDMPCLVRVPSAAPEWILNALDCGAQGVVVPHVDSLKKAQDIAQLAHFGAAGRGYAGSTRAASYTKASIAEHLSNSQKSTTVIAQIEDLAAFDELEEIAQVDGIDCLFVGRIDLTVALGKTDPKDPEVVKLVQQVCDAGRRWKKPVGMFVGDLNEVAHWQEQGATLFLLGSDHGFLYQGAQLLLDKFNS